MKRISLVLGFFLWVFLGFSQSSESSSGKVSFSISKDKKYENKSRLQFNSNSNSEKTKLDIKVKDETAPLITIIKPVVKRGFKHLAESKTIEIIGKVEDESGIFEVVINGIDANVSAEGVFRAIVPLAYGDNTITIRATDIKMNSDKLEFIVERKTSEMIAVEVKKSATSNASNSITWLSPSQTKSSVEHQKINLNACINAAGNLKSLTIYQNEWRLVERDLRNVSRNADCKYMLNETIELKAGINQIRVEVIGEEHTFGSQIEINYNLMTSHYHALIIGVQDYADPKINDLFEPINDAQKVVDVLTGKYTFEKENITFLKNPTKAEIIGTLHKMRSTITQEDNLLIFYAGHGYWDKDMNNGYWLPSDANKDNPVNWFPNTDLTNYLNVIKTKHTILIADACFSGGIFRTRNAFNNNLAIEQLYKLPSRKAITSGTLTEVPDKSVFLQYFLKRLDENTEKYLSAEQLFSSLRMAVINNSANIPQYGTIQNVGDEGGDFIFIMKE